jgi:hypothetical protein
MFFVNKHDREEVVELIYSGVGFCIVIDQTETLNNKDGNPVGKILKYGKKELKKHFKKVKADNKAVKIEPINDTMKEQTIETFEIDKIGIMEYTEDYVENKKYLDRQEEIAKQTEADRIRMMKELADDYNPNGVKIKD